MKYILMMNTMKAGSQGFPGWAKKDMQAHIAFMVGFCKELGEFGELVSARRLPVGGYHTAKYSSWLSTIC